MNLDSGFEMISSLHFFPVLSCFKCPIQNDPLDQGATMSVGPSLCSIIDGPQGYNKKFWTFFSILIR